jgi:N-acetylmuramoyl-L-alanine amidase
MVPVEQGVLLTKKIVLDTETNDLQVWQVTRLLMDKLQEAGATVFRPDPIKYPTVEERALYANKTGADVLLNFEEEKDGKRVGYYYSSEEGKKLARAVGSALDRDIGESSHFLVVHTGMPAVTIRMGTSKDPEETALRIFNGLLSYFR